MGAMFTISMQKIHVHKNCEMLIGHTLAPPSFSTLYPKKIWEPGKTYHMSDVAGGTDLFEHT